MDDLLADEWLFEVEEVFSLSYGVVIVCGLSASSAALRASDALLFRYADGSEVETQIQQIPLTPRALRLRNLAAIELPKTPETLRIQAGAQAFRRAAST